MWTYAFTDVKTSTFINGKNYLKRKTKIKEEELIQKRRERSPTLAISFNMSTKLCFYSKRYKRKIKSINMKLKIYL